MRLKVIGIGVVLLALGLATYSYAVSAHLEDYPCSETIASTTVLAHPCPYVGVAGSTIRAAGILLGVLGCIIIGVGFIPENQSPIVEDGTRLKME